MSAEPNTWFLVMGVPPTVGGGWFVLRADGATYKFKGSFVAARLAARLEAKRLAAQMRETGTA